VARRHGEEMNVRIDEPRQNRRVGERQQLGPPAESAPHVAGRAQRDDTSAHDAHGPCIGKPPAGAAYAAADDDDAPGAQSDDGNGFASFSFISVSQQVSSPPPPLLHSTSTPQDSQRYRFPSCVAMRAP
jgi:hypothetical protein